MEPIEYKAVEHDGSWAVAAISRSSFSLAAVGIGSLETARIIARLLKLNSWNADALESGEIEIVKVR